MMRQELVHHFNQQQRGAVLVIGLILLIAMTLIGVTAMKLTTLDERIAANTQRRTAVFQAAESVLSEAVVYDNVLKCASTRCKCLPDKVTDCKEQQGLVTREKYNTGGDKPIEAVAGMNFKGNVNIFGNSIGSGSEIAGRLVEIRAVSGTGTAVTAQHNLQVAPIGLRKK